MTVMDQNTKIICNNSQIVETFDWTKVLTMSQWIHKENDRSDCWVLYGQCIFAVHPQYLVSHPLPNEEVLKRLTEAVSAYYQCMATVCYQDGTFTVTLLEDMADKKLSYPTMTFGAYPQDGDAPEPLQWLILEETEKDLLLLSKYAIATKGFVFDCWHEPNLRRKCLWEFSDLRQWLQQDFYPAAFGDAEKQQIIPTRIQTVSEENLSEDHFQNQVFLLSKKQVEQYLFTPQLRMGIRTPNAAKDPKAMVVHEETGHGVPWWILPFQDAFGMGSFAQMAFYQGTQYHGRNVGHADWAVRPAIRIKKINKGDPAGLKLMCDGKELEEFAAFLDDESNHTDWYIGDITAFEGDCIVNAANRSLLGGGGVDGAIHKAAGPELRDVCSTLGGCETGEAKLTPGFRLKASYVIHTVGPVYSKDKASQCEQLLRNCYVNALNMAKDRGIQSIAFPSISTGVFGYPKEDAALVALDAVAQWKKNNPYKIKVSFCCFNETMYQIYEQANKKRLSNGRDTAKG